MNFQAFRDWSLLHPTAYGSRIMDEIMVIDWPQGHRGALREIAEIKRLSREMENLQKISNLGVASYQESC